jgi:imidazolonepropionase-like amidohydrolase
MPALVRLDSLELARGAGVSKGFGTDLLGELHDQQSRELSIRRHVLSSAEILRSATVVNAEIVRASDEIGTIKVGARGDLFVIDGDPLADIAVLENAYKMHAVIQGGRVAVSRGFCPRALTQP